MEVEEGGGGAEVGVVGGVRGEFLEEGAGEEAEEAEGAGEGKGEGGGERGDGGEREGEGGGWEEEEVLHVEEGDEVLLFLDGVVQAAVADPRDAGVDEGAGLGKTEGREGEALRAAAAADEEEEHILGAISGK